MYICRFGSRPEIADLMNTDISQLFRGEQQGTPWVLANGHVPVVEVSGQQMAEICYMSLDAAETTLGMHGVAARRRNHQMHC